MTGRVLEYPTKTRFREALQQGLAQGRAEGKAEGRAEGFTQGIKQGIAQGLAQGMAQGKAEAYISLVKDGLLSLKDAAKRLNMSEEDIKIQL